VDEWQQYRRKGLAEMRAPRADDSADDISVSKEDAPEWEGPRDGKVARNPTNHADMWYVSAKYFAENFEPA